MLRLKPELINRRWLVLKNFDARSPHPEMTTSLVLFSLDSLMICSLCDTIVSGAKVFNPCGAYVLMWFDAF